MSETVENTEENKQEEGVTNMSLSDALNFSEGIEKQPEVLQEPEKTDVVEAKTEEIEPAKEEVVEQIKAEEEELEKIAEPKVEVKDQEVTNPYEDLMDEEDRAYFNFKKNNKGATRADYNESKVDYDKLDRKDLLRKSLRERYSLSDDDASLDEYIETEHGIPMDADESEMSLTERVRLRKLTDSYVNDKKAQQQKWSENNVEEKSAPKEENIEMVTLENGKQMPKKEYQEIVESRNKYIKGNEEALNRVNATSFNLKVDDNGSEREIEYSYEFDKEDKHRMQSISSDVVTHFNKTYTTKEGYDHDGINIDQAWGDKQLRGKMLQKMAQTIRAEAIEEVMSEKGNITIGKQKGLPQQETKGVKIVPLTELLNNY